MRDHRDIIAAAGGATRLARLLKMPSERAFQWKRSNSIPARYWAPIVGRGLASLEELAAAIPHRR